MKKTPTPGSSAKTFNPDQGGQAQDSAGEILRFTQFVVDHISDAVYLAARDGRLVYVNQAACRALGYTRDELLSMYIMELIPGYTAEVWAERWQHIKKLGNLTFENQHRKKNGELFPVEVRADYVEFGNQAYLCGLARDISARRQTEQALQKERGLLRTVLDYLPDSVYIKDTQGRKLLTNRADLNFIGAASEDEVLGKTDWDVFPEGIASYITKEEQAILETNQPMLNREELLINRLGKQFWLLTSKLPYRNEKGEVIGIIGLGRDVTSRRQAEDALRASEAKYRLLTESIQDVVWVMDAESMRFTYVSPSVFNQRGYSVEEIMAETVTTSFDPRMGKLIRRMNERHIADFKAGRLPEGTFFSEEIKQPHKNGSFVWTEVVTQYYLNPVNGRVEVLGVSHDISQRKQMELAIRERVKELTCLFNIGRLLENDAIQMDELCQRTAEYLIPAMQYPELAFVLIQLEGQGYRAGNPPVSLAHRLNASISLHGQDFGQVTVYYNQPNKFFPEEQALLDNTARMLALWLERKQTAAEVNKLTQAVEQSPLNIFITDLDWKIVYVNPAFTTLTGYSPEEALGQRPGQLLRSSFDAPEEILEMDAALAAGQTWRGEILNRKKNGELYWESASVAPLRDENGKIIQYLAIKQDISQQKADQQRTAEALELNQTMRQASPVGILTYKASGECIAANQAAAQILGTSPQELLKQNFRQIKSWQTSGLEQTALEALEAWQKAAVTVKFTTTFGKKVQLQGSMVPFSLTGEAHLLFMFEDTTDRELAERKLKDSQEKYRSLFEDAPIMIWEEDLSAVAAEFAALRKRGVQDWRAYFESQPDEVRRLVGLVKVTDINEANLAFYGARDKAEVMRALSETLVNESWPVFTEEFIALAQGATSYESEVPTRTLRLGEIKQTFLKLSVASSQRENLSQVIVSIVDMTARKQAEREVKDNQEKYLSLFEDAPIMIWEEDLTAVAAEFEALRARGVQDWQAYFESQPQELKHLVGLIKITDINEANLAFYGAQDKAEVIRGLPGFLVDDSWPVLKKEFTALAQGATSFECEMPTMTLRGERKQVYLKLSVASSQGERLSRVIISLVDITARKQAEDALQAAHAELEGRVQARTAELQTANLALARAARAKDDFLATMSHELRTPLTGILGLSQALELQLKDVLNEKQLNSLQTIEKSGQRLHELINDVLDYSRLQAGEIKLQIGPFLLGNTLKNGMQELKRQALEKHQQIVILVEPEDLALTSDERRVKQIVTNLLKNAIKFTPEGGHIELTASARPEQREVQISVCDSGIGIQSEDLERMFQPFTQLDARLAREHGGTGLGLALVKILAELLGGRVTVVSTPGQGSCFNLFLPRE